jgi:protein-S-isoprenylcysteine O-methyltransferase Ste14
MSDQVHQGALPHAPPSWAAHARAFVNFFVFDFPGGPKAIKAAWVINAQKGGSFPLYLFLLWYYRNSTAAAWIYVALQGAYGLVWLIKACAFPDPNWEAKVTIGGAVNMFAGVLGWYWFMGWLLISTNATPAYPLPVNLWFCLCVSLCVIGCTIMIASDAQKFFTLRVNRGLITDGMFRSIRHPNYLGEMMIYGSFALMIWQWAPFVILTCVWLVLFATNMAMKEASMSRFPEWAEYRNRTWWLVPGVL